MIDTLTNSKEQTNKCKQWNRNSNFRQLLDFKVSLATAGPGSSSVYFLTLGKVIDGLILHPDNEHIIYPLGTTLVVRHIISRTQQFLRVGAFTLYDFILIII